MGILPLPQIKEEQLSPTGENRKNTEYWQTTSNRIAL